MTDQTANQHLIRSTLKLQSERCPEAALDIHLSLAALNGRATPYPVIRQAGQLVEKLATPR